MGFAVAQGKPEAVSYRRMLGIQLLALLPVTVVAIVNCGYQYYQGLVRLPGFDADDSRGWLARFLGADSQHPGIYDYLATGVAQLLPMLLLALLVGGLWERIIADRRREPVQPGFVLVALVFVLLMPGAAAFTHIAFGMSCAALLGRGIFGGEGKSFINPALLGVAMVQVSFPAASGVHPLWNGLAGYEGSDAFALYSRGGDAALGEAGIDAWSAFIGAVPGQLGTTSLIAVALGAALLLLTRIISWRLLSAQLVGLLLFASLVPVLGGAPEGIAAMPVYWHFLLGSFAFGAVFVACDPAASCCTNPGRWIQGFLIAALLVVIRVFNPVHPDAVVPVLLLASLVAPLIDHLVIARNIRLRGQRHV